MGRIGVGRRHWESGRASAALGGRRREGDGEGRCSGMWGRECPIERKRNQLSWSPVDEIRRILTTERS